VKVRLDMPKSVKHLYGHGRNECDGEIGVLNTAELIELSLVKKK